MIESRLLLLCTLALGGCFPIAKPRVEDREQSLASQIISVRAGESDVIQVERVALADADLAALADLPNLHSLLLDHSGNQISAAGIRHLQKLPLVHLRIRGAGIDDDAIAEIAAFHDLKIMNLPTATFTDRALELLAGLAKLEQLRFGSPNVTDRGMEHLRSLAALKQLHLIDVPITDTGLKVLADIKDLQSLYLDGAKVSDASLEALFRQRPDLHVHLNQQHHDHDPHQHRHP